MMSTGSLVATTVTAEIDYGFTDVEIDDKISYNWALWKTGGFVATIGTAAIDTNRSV